MVDPVEKSLEQSRDRPESAPEVIDVTGGPSDIVESTINLQDDIRKCLDDAEALKQEGNEHFRSKKWNEALASYRMALGRLPKRLSPPRSARSEEGQSLTTVEDEEPTSSQNANKEASPEADASVGTSEENAAVHGPECAKARAVINANIGACHLKLGEYKEVVTACSEALKDDPDYVKALQRRATANEQINSWSSLSSAQEDYKRLVELLPPTSPELVGIRRSMAALPPRIEAAQKRETAEMLDKLKGLGNSILGNFGLSTDNFQFVPNGQGGYSMNFVR
ncbi:TPR-like protein [Trametes polyzona]|nr:TPR-like protein [Trametes polyzona]